MYTAGEVGLNLRALLWDGSMEAQKGQNTATHLKNSSLKYIIESVFLCVMY